MILAKKEILEELALGNIVIDPVDPKNFGPNSVDLTLGDEFYVLNNDSELEYPKYSNVYPNNGMIALMPGCLYLATTREKCGSKFYVPCIEGRSTLARQGISVHQTAGFGDVGFIGQWTLEITVMIPTVLYVGMRICQAYFMECSSHEYLYNGNYKNQIGVNLAKGGNF